MAITTYELTGYANGAAVKSALDKAWTALQAGDLGYATATDGQVLTADGVGGAAWETPTSASTGLAVALAIVFGA